MRAETGGKSLRDLVAFFAVACGVSWLDWGLIIASGRGWLPFSVPLNPWGSFGPALAALLVTGLRGGRSGLRALLSPIGRWRFGLGWWAAVLLGPPALVVLAVALHALGGGQVLPAGPVGLGQTALLALLLLFVGGPIGEEIGWRGYALPALLDRMSPLSASVVVAGMWAVWHFPLFWLPGSAQEGSSILVFVALVVAFSVLTTWIYLATSGSLLAAVLFHHAINLSTFFLPSFLPALDGARAFDRLFLAVTWVAAAVVLPVLRRRRPGPPAHGGAGRRGTGGLDE